MSIKATCIIYLVDKIAVLIICLTKTISSYLQADAVIIIMKNNHEVTNTQLKRTDDH